MRHVAVMTATGAIGLMAVFVVSINIGLVIATSATVSRALGAGDRPRARRLAASALTITAVFSAAMATAMFVFRDWGLAALLHARGEPAEVASHFIAISIPANVPLALGMGMSGVLR